MIRVRKGLRFLSPAPKRGANFGRHQRFEEEQQRIEGWKSLPAISCNKIIQKVEAPGEESFTSEEHVEATSASDYEEGMINSLRVEKVDPKEDKLRKAKGKACMITDKFSEVLNDLLTGSSSGPFLTQTKVRESIIAALQSLPWGSISRRPSPSRIKGQVEPIDMKRSPLSRVPLVAHPSGQTGPSTIVNGEFPKTDATSDVLCMIRDLSDS
ncbi:hypothetical protein AMTR_s00113p00038320 [Amborella trichopoda]|uniref:Uncharacterized protein n=1 Tax=Amborella trichopoda TaxID=13333 RepID=W1NTK3_AMBTC|nr:hypothetical protein AMTR_s00113p00038320 [Amborella trichopoda]